MTASSGYNSWLQRAVGKTPYGLQVVTPPIEEPVLLPEAKLHLRVDHDDDNTLIQNLITVARDYAERFTSRALITQTLAMYMDGFPIDSLYGAIRLPRTPVTAITSITYTDTSGVTQTWSNTLYRVDLVSEPARIEPVYGVPYPALRYISNSVCVTFTAGYGDHTTVPIGIKQGMLMKIADLYDQRSGLSAGMSIAEVKSNTADALLYPYRMLEAT